MILCNYCDNYALEALLECDSAECGGNHCPNCGTDLDDCCDTPAEVRFDN